MLETRESDKVRKAGEFTWGKRLCPTSYQERQVTLLWETNKLTF